MKIKSTFILLCFIFTSLMYAQDSLLYKWIPKGVAGINVSQIALSNWTKGGDNSISWTVNGTFGLGYTTLNWDFKNNLTAAYGRTKIGGTDFRTNDNDLYFETVLARKLSWAVDPYVSNTVRTAIAPGYNYKVEPAERIAGFFDPGYITQSIGFTYNQLTGFTTRLGFAVQEVFTKDYNQYTDDTTTAEIERFKFETGLESVSTAEYTLMENVAYKGLLRLFTRYESLDVWDVRWENAIVMKVNDLINVNITYLFIYEKQQSPTAQMKETFQLGFVYTLF